MATSSKNKKVLETEKANLVAVSYRLVLRMCFYKKIATSRSLPRLFGMPFQVCLFIDVQMAINTSQRENSLQKIDF